MTRIGATYTYKLVKFPKIVKKNQKIRNFFANKMSNFPRFLESKPIFLGKIKNF